MNFARGLLNDPWIFFLDEPTLGLDVSAARSVRELVLAWKAAVPGRTVLLTTHYMAEADELCDRIAIVDHGRILALGTPDELKRRVQRESVFRLELDRLDGGAAALRRLPGVVSAAVAAGDQDDGQAIARRSRSTSPSSTTRRSAGSSARSAGSARTSSPCASPSRRSRTSSSSWSGAASTRSRRATATRRTEPPAPRRPTPGSDATTAHEPRRGAMSARATAVVVELATRSSTARRRARRRRPNWTPPAGRR